jgi:cell division protein FtsZ
MSDTLKSLFSGAKSSPAQRDESVSANEVRPEMTPGAVIRVLGAGGGGGNAVDRMIKSKVKGVDFIVVNTDVQALYHNGAPTKITIGRGTTRGLGAGANPAVGKKAAEESTEEIKSALEGADMVFLTSGLGGGTGSGSMEVIADLARSMGILTVAVVTKPFSFEGNKRMQQANDALDKLKDKVDTLITIPNDKILSLIDKTTPLTEAFQVVDEVLQHAIEGISSLITIHGLINVDFADVKSVMQDAGTALMGIGYGSGDNRAAEAARAAVDSPLLELSIDGAKGILFNITGGNDMSMFEVDEAARIITEAADPEANIIFGAVIDESFTGEIKCTVVATGFEEATMNKTMAYGGTNFRSVAAGLAAKATSAQHAVPNMPDTSSRTQSKFDEQELEVPAFMRKQVSGN